MPNKVEFNKDYPVIKKSDEYYKIALDLIPAQTQTLAKGPGQNIKGVAPKYLQKGKGSHVWDVDGNEYIDYTMGVGPLSLGYAYHKVDEAIKKQLEDGITFSLMHPLEVEIAELIHKVVPNAEAIRYSKVGADVTSAAVRVARAFTGRNKVLCCGYHGWHDWYIAVTDRNKGIPQAVQDLSFTFNYNDIQSVIDGIDEDTAVGGAQEYFGVRADLATFSKAVANGMPISIITGRKDVMSLFDKDVFFFSTFGGEALSLAAVKATVNELIDKNVPAYLAKQGRKLKDGYNSIAEKLGMNYTKCSGFDCRTIMTFDGEKSGCNPLEMKSLVQQEMIKRGILWGGFHNVSFSHADEDVSYTLKAYEDVLPILKNAVDEKNIKKYLKGEPVEPVFRKTSNFNLKPKKR
jgi:glutamate-1-semialdehyde 2,1-aminomutase